MTTNQEIDCKTSGPNINEATSKLLFVAVDIPVLARMMGLARKGADRLTFSTANMRWLVTSHPSRPDSLSFDPDVFSKKLNVASHGEKLAMLFLLNVWNPQYAKDKGWHFDLFDAAGVLDGENLAAIARWMLSPVWP